MFGVCAQLFILGRPFAEKPAPIGPVMSYAPLPDSWLDHALVVMSVHRICPDTTIRRPLFQSRVPAGFPSPADDYVEGALDLNEHLIQKKAATYFVRVSGQSMIEAGIHDGDLLVVDRSEEPKEESVVIAALDGELTVKRYRTIENQPHLVPEAEGHAPIPIEPGHYRSIIPIGPLAYASPFSKAPQVLA